MPSGERNTLQSNIHQAEKQPKLHHHSDFFPIAERVEKLDEYLHEFVEKDTKRFVFKNSPEIAFFKGKETEASYSTSYLNLPYFPDGLKLPTVFTLDTPEANALTLGRLLGKGNKARFQLARFHTGRLAEEDMRQFSKQAVQIPEVKEFTDKLSSPERQSYIIYLTREGHLTDWHGAIFHEENINVPYTISHAEHDPAENSFGRVAKICPINFEGIIPTDIKLLTLSDNTASAMQQVAVIEDTLNYIENRNSKKQHVEKVLIVSPLLTLYGATIISYYNAKRGINTSFVTAGTLLGCNPPDRYFSPITPYENLIPNAKTLNINRAVHNEKTIYKACVRCNWTASFTAPRLAYKKSEEELRLLGSSNEELIKLGNSIGPNKLRSLGIFPDNFIPYSSYLEAN